LIEIGFEVQVFLLVFFRVMAMLWLLPLFQSRSVSTVYKAGLGLIIAFVVYPSAHAVNLNADGFLIFIAVLKEVFIGLSVGFFVRILFSMVSAAGEVISMQSGLSFARMMDPAMTTNVTIIEQLKSLLAIMIFLGMDGHHTVIKALSASIKQIPPGSVAPKPILFEYLIGSVGSIFAASLKICAPVVVTLFLVDLALGILVRLVPQVNVFVEGASIKIIITLAVLAMALNLIAPVIAGLFRGMETEIPRILRYLG
jgi:flagellar biosynthesis protein FliR